MLFLKSLKEIGVVPVPPLEVKVIFNIYIGALRSYEMWYTIGADVAKCTVTKIKSENKPKYF